MKTIHRNRPLAARVCALLGTLALASAAAGGGTARPSAPSAAAPHAADNPASAHGCGDDSCQAGGSPGRTEGTQAETAAAIEARLSAPCECGVPTYQCAECRYEVGVVKISGNLLKREAGGGLVRTQAVERIAASAGLPATGEVALDENATVHISPRIAGIIEAAPAHVGTRVQAGDTLLTLTSVELGRALAEHERNRTLAELSERILARETRLRGQNVASEQELIDAQMAYEQHRAELKASEQTLHVLGLTDADLQGMRTATNGAAAGRLPVRAPLAGTVIEKHAVPGELAETGKNLMTLSDLTTVWVWADVHSRDLAPLLAAERRGPVAVDIAVAAFPQRRFSGKLAYVGATMSEESRTVKVRATVENPEQLLRPGMFCEATFAIANGPAEDVLAARRSALVTDEGSTFVFKHWKDDFYVRQNVRAGREFGGMVEILDGLRSGETVVTEGAFLLKSDVLREKMGAGCAD